MCMWAQGSWRLTIVSGLKSVLTGISASIRLEARGGTLDDMSWRPKPGLVQVAERDLRFHITLGNLRAEISDVAFLRRQRHECGLPCHQGKDKCEGHQTFILRRTTRH